MSRARRTIVWVLPIVVIGALLLLALRNGSGYARVSAGSTAPEYAAATLDGDSLALASLRGRVVLLNVWATWCKPCVKEMPALQRLHEELSDDGLSVVAVSVDNAALGLGSVTEGVRRFVDDLGVTFDVLLDPAKRVESAFQVMGLPMTFLIDREGRIRQKVLGAREWDHPDMQAEIRKLLES